MEVSYEGWKHKKIESICYWLSFLWLELKGEETVTKKRFGNAATYKHSRLLSSPLLIVVGLVLVEGVGGRAVGLEPRAVVVEDVPRLIGVVKVHLWLGLHHNGAVTVYLVHLRHSSMLILIFLQHLSVLFDEPLPVVPHHQKITISI